MPPREGREVASRGREGGSDGRSKRQSRSLVCEIDTLPAERRSGGATVCQACHASHAFSLPVVSDRLLRQPDRDHQQQKEMEGGWTDTSKGSAESKEHIQHATGNLFVLLPSSPVPRPPSPVPPFLTALVCFCAACYYSTHRLPLPAATRPCQPYYWPGTSPIAPRTSITHTHTLTFALPSPAQKGPRLPALTYRRPLLHPHRVQAQACPGERHLTARNISFSPWGIQLRGQQACSGASDANSRARAAKAETNTSIRSLLSLLSFFGFDTSPLISFFLVVTVIACAFFFIPSRLVLLVFASPA